MGKKNIYSAFLAVAFLAALSSCDKNDNGGVEPPPVVTQPYRYVVVATSPDGTYILQTDSISSGQISIQGNGIETEAATAWIFYGAGSASVQAAEKNENKENGVN
jgi:hypothetical protein